jgi:hypothetical protein
MTDSAFLEVVDITHDGSVQNEERRKERYIR